MSGMSGLVTTVWRCLSCGQEGKFEHQGLTGQDLVEELKVSHYVQSPGCQFWETKVKMRTIR